MFKRVKSLVLAGALVLGMAVPAFAEGEGTPEEPKTALEMVTENYKKEMTIGNVSDKTRTILESHLIRQENWEKFVQNINGNNNDGLHIIAPNEVKGNGPHEYKVYFNASFNDADLKNDELIETINITFTDRKNEDKGIFEIISPETGDIIAYGGLGLAVIAGAGLYISNKKRK